MTYTLAVVDDHQLFRDGLRARLSAHPDLRVVSEAEDARSAYEAVAAQNPDMVVLDVLLPGSTGLSVARELIRTHPKLKILMMSGDINEDAVAEALALGAKGYASKTQPAGELITAIRAVAQGHSYLAPRISRFLVDDYLRLRRGGQERTGPLGALSPRERETFDLLVRGHGNDQIAQQFRISKRTVETHRSRILQKLHVHSVAELFRFAARHGLLQHDD